MRWTRDYFASLQACASHHAANAHAVEAPKDERGGCRGESIHRKRVEGMLVASLLVTHLGSLLPFLVRVSSEDRCAQKGHEEEEDGEGGKRIESMIWNLPPAHEGERSAVEMRMWRISCLRSA